MRVRRDFVRIYAQEEDPWSIGDAMSPRYDAYRELVLRHAHNRNKLLDLGCGLGAFVARFAGDFDELVGTDISARAVAEAGARHPEIRFLQASIDELDQTPLDTERFDAIVCSDVLYYLPEVRRRRTLAWIASHLSPHGIALIAAWSPGGTYLVPDELASLVRREFKIVEQLLLETGHAGMLVERKRRLVALTFDYETWQPIPPGKEIDWEADVFAPADALLEACNNERVPITLFAEMGEYLWLLENEHELAARMEAQWRDAVANGHEIGLHLHPSWLPELGATRADNTWRWDWSRARADDYPGDLTSLIARCKEAIESAVRTVDAHYRVRTFRAGAYQAQPFSRLFSALAQNGIECDSSVFAGGVSRERGYDYRLAWSTGQPHFASPVDPQLRAAPAEQALVELPIFTFAPGDRLLLDGAEGARFAGRLVAETDSRYHRHPTSERLRRRARLRGFLGLAYVRLARLRLFVNGVAPRRLLWYMSSHGPEVAAGHDYFVGIGHTKGPLDVHAVAQGIRTLKRDGRFDLVTLSEAASVARAELVQGTRDATAETEFQIKREFASVLGDERNERQSHLLQEMIPLDREQVLDLGCGAGYWSARIADLYPWMHVVGVDVGTAFIERAIERFSSVRVSFEHADFAALPFGDGSFDCVYADNTLEHAFDIGATLAEAHRVLRNGGTLVAAIPSDARNPNAVVDNHTWKTAPHDVSLRLRCAGFTNIEVREIDVLRGLRQGPYAPSADQMMYVRAWKRPADITQAERAVEAMDWVYRRLDPVEPHEGNDATAIIAGGRAFCAGYTVALGELLRREGVDVSWVAMEAERHPHGRGARQVDTHNVLAATVDGRDIVLDPMSNTMIDHPLLEVFRQPTLADSARAHDQRYREREYDLYATHFWYERVRRFQLHRKLNPHLRIWRRVRSANGVQTH